MCSFVTCFYLHRLSSRTDEDGLLIFKKCGRPDLRAAQRQFGRRFSDFKRWVLCDILSSNLLIRHDFVRSAGEMSCS